MQADTDMRPTGFSGPVVGLGDLRRHAERVLVLPRDLAALAAFRQQRSEASWQRIEVLALTESMGRVEDLVRDLAAMLEAGGTLLLDVENLQSVRQLRAVLEGRPGSFDPFGSCEDPSQALSRRRLLQALAVAGLHTADVYEVPSPLGDPPAGFAAALAPHGFLPVAWLHGAPPARFWLLAHKQAVLPGTVLIGPGSEAAHEHTRRRLLFLPDGWEVIELEPGPECAAWNRGIARARGEFVWFLRAGAEPQAGLFAALCDQVVLGPVAPGRAGERQLPGDVSGLMVARQDLLLTGPLPEHWQNTPIALEDYGIRLDTCVVATRVVDGELLSAPAPVEQPRAFAGEARALLEHWQPLTEGRTGAASRVALPETAAPLPWQGRAVRVSLCMIARNEQRFLPDCLRLAAPAVDEIVLVDTGSTDDTIAIAESFGAKVLHRAWDDDFSAPRNLGLQHATGDWILVLDADEFLLGDAAAQIRELVQDPKVAGYHLRFTNAYSGGKTLGVMMVRLFRNLPGVEYRNFIHEQMTPSLTRIGAEHGLMLSSCEVEVLHQGYTDEVMDSRQKNERNERLFKKQLRQHPDDLYTLYKFGDFLRRVPGRCREARELLERCLELVLAGAPMLPRELPYAGEVAALCALEYAREGRHERAREIVDHALRRFLATPNLHYIAASLDLGANRPDDAILQFKRCLAYRDQVLVVPIQDGITSYVSLCGIAQALLQKGEPERAERLLRQAIAIQPDYEVSHLVLSRLHLHRQQPQQALAVLTAYLERHPEAAGVCQQVTLILHHLGLADQARRMGSHALQILTRSGQDHEAEHMQRILAAL